MTIFILHWCWIFSSLVSHQRSYHVVLFFILLIKYKIMISTWVRVSVVRLLGSQAHVVLEYFFYLLIFFRHHTKLTSVSALTLIDFQMLHQPFIIGINPNWPWLYIFLIYFVFMFLIFCEHLGGYES